ncbi:MAG TPA: copper homeostasis protein [Firmicutes bacterium]|mgnify:FL=1|jgi:copper homeostasis protein|nr:copper homeostasis protein [Bacillota bacterium]HBG43778.1 copper homeostasis protein [Bacillota bacterium]HBL69446.1 copper homeostasis protein [Bacillota bacterium]HCX71379.1 copper homeostasis protein [Bacillota bacterium]
MLEIIATTVQDALIIAEGGADRIELVSALSEGGLTPSYGLMRQAINAANIPVNVMIRPHSAGFVYDEADLLCMIEDIKQARASGANGVVFGMLTADGDIDLPRLERLLEYCDGLEVTFHRAIDDATDILAATRLVAATPICRVLSSGGLDPGRAEEHLAVLHQMQAILSARGKRLLVGGGVTKENCRTILQSTGAPELHVGTAVRHGASAREAISLAAVQELVRHLGTASKRRGMR